MHVHAHVLTYAVVHSAHARNLCMAHVKVLQRQGHKVNNGWKTQLAAGSFTDWQETGDVYENR